MEIRRHVGRGAAPGKVILFGEHSVVYGQPAIAAALGHGLGATVIETGNEPRLQIPRWTGGGLSVAPNSQADAGGMDRAFAIAMRAVDLSADQRFSVTIDGELPLGVGLGSSAAFAVSLLRGLADFQRRQLSESDLLAHAQEIETLFHGNPSGLDHTVAATGRCLYFVAGERPTFETIDLKTTIPLVVAWTPRRGTTAEAVRSLRTRWTQSPSKYDRLFTAMGDISLAGRKALEAGDLAQLGHLFQENHKCLQACGVSDPSNDQMVDIALAEGALGAKLTGAGQGGAVIALCPKEPRRVVEAIAKAGFSALFTHVN
ncbi:MAG: mevalonate kinase [Myxococcales bacterium]|nr:mevalonate kinase [Myxococcales bacterium]